jgi:hypothetical protein
MSIYGGFASILDVWLFLRLLRDGLQATMPQERTLS